jgi:hypothetical protein
MDPQHWSCRYRKSLSFFKATVEWFKIYKMPDGKPPNEFAFDGKPKVSKRLT